MAKNPAINAHIGAIHSPRTKAPKPAIEVGPGDVQSRPTVLNLEEQVFQYWTERQHRKVAQCRHDDQESCEQNAEGKTVGWQRSAGSRCFPLLREQTGKDERWNGHAKSPCH